MGIGPFWIVNFELPLASGSETSWLKLNELFKFFEFCSSLVYLTFFKVLSSVPKKLMGFAKI